MNKIFLGIGSLIPIFSASISLVSMSNEKLDDEKEKIENFCLYDFIRLTGNFEAQILSSKLLYSKETHLNKRIVFFKNKGYSIFDIDLQKIVEVNPNYLGKVRSYLANSKLVNNKNIIVIRNGLVDFELHNLQDRDRTMIGDRRRKPKAKPKKEADKKYPKYYPTNKEKGKIKNFSDFKNSDLEELRTAGSKNHKEYKIKESYLDLLYADYEVDNSWFFKVVNGKHIGDNEPTKYLPNPKQDWGGICGFLSMTSLLLYNEYFKNSQYFGYFDKLSLIKTIQNYRVNIDYDESKMGYWDYNGEIIHNTDKYMEEALYYHYRDMNKEDKKKILVNEIIPHLQDQFYINMMQTHNYFKGTTSTTQKKLINDFMSVELKNGWANYNIYNFGVSNANFEKYLKNKKIPIEASMSMNIKYGSDLEKKEKVSGHSFIVYGLYKDGRLLATYNWTASSIKNLREMEWNQIILDQSTIRGAMTMEDTTKGEAHLKRYFWNGDVHVNGVEMTKNLKSWGFIK
ncbi:putative cysteine peptidase [[Mycoplasma] anseris]|nr:hypothetical protein [[Mycoplasma] anseris]